MHITRNSKKTQRVAELIEQGKQDNWVLITIQNIKLAFPDSVRYLNAFL